MSAYVAVTCDQMECSETWASGELDANTDATVAGAFSYLSDMETWTVRGESIFCPAHKPTEQESGICATCGIDERYPTAAHVIDCPIPMSAEATEQEES